MTLRKGPPGVESQSDADAVIAPLCREIRDAALETPFRGDLHPGPLGAAASAVHRRDGRSCRCLISTR